MNLLQLGSLTEEEARKYLEAIRWPDGVVCPHCGVAEGCYALNGKATRKGLYKCASCRKQFTVTVKTIMEDSHLSCKQWVIALHLMCSSKKGISALQLQRELGLKSYRSAWFLAHRIRVAMEDKPTDDNLLSGSVEIDETWVGGKAKQGQKGYKDNKAPVVVMISRKDGRAISKPVDRVTTDNLMELMYNYISKKARLLTDELHAYKAIGESYEGGHFWVTHSKGQFSRGKVHSNTAESYFALLKRGVHGTFHHVSKKHLERYCNEFAYRFSRRKIEDSERRTLLIKQTDLKRLKYVDLVRDKD